MRVLVIGSTGTLGGAAVPQLIAAGHRVSGLARNDERAAVVRQRGAEPVVADLFDVEQLTDALQGHDAVVNLATRVPVGGKLIRSSSWAQNGRIRVEGSKALVRAATAADVGILVQEGVALAYADGGERELDEEAALDLTGPPATSVVAHDTVAGFARDGRIAVRLRIANVHGDEPLTRWIVKGASGFGPSYFGSKDGWITPVHPDDVGSAVVAALAAPTGVYNVGATPLRKHEFGAVVAAKAGARKARTVPLAFGFMKILARSQRVVSTKLTETTGWKPERPVVAPEWFPAP
ncbi:NAD-dependent epimerase/dehydratase family protein [Kibdelosporangium phytohabitans]|uniref:NAD-dependent dehydratase n=1 Tax=Kibdelosporangium phytohabitans TaxID=860235 RepID=A0A0N9HW02_9PSEU|nr:NAD-dependent epimerase/dehydratase family protein [Kibdelosporangium phytohabitans]ALG11640.1 NAD-dependent dehydratase [Kibdelosporangium phytohabitans]MBE1463026.1 nucleoside-diphosphate-sugar epimerase [Kibdelosporangium phytohabitans]